MPGIDPPVPYQWNVADVASAALLNAQIYNGLTYLENPPIFYAYQAAAQSITTATFTNLLFDTELWDTENGHSTTSNSQRYTCQRAGKYQIDGCVSFTNNSTGFRALKVVLNNASVGTIGGERSSTAVAGFDTTVSVSTPVQMNVGDFVTLQCYQNSGGTIATDTNTGNEYVTCFAARWISL